MKAVIFDMDGVLIDSMKYHIYSWNKAFENFNLKATERELSLFEGMSFSETIDIISKGNNVILSKEEKDKLYYDKKRILNDIFKFELYDEILEILHFLKNNYLRLGLVTGSNKEFANKIVEKYFENLFDVIITSDDVENGKPNPEPYEKAKQNLGFNNSDFLVVENAPLGIESGKGAGLKVLALETTLSRIDLEKADLILKDHNELFNYIRNNVKVIGDIGD